MAESPPVESVFLANLAAIDRIISVACRRFSLRPDAASDFASWVKLRLIEDDYAVFRKFRGESAITTYLTVVITMLFRDYRVHHWGRWRPSTAAQRLGPLAVRLEALIYRDRLSLTGAGESLRASGETDCSDRALAALLQQLPHRAPLRPHLVAAEVIEGTPSAERADEKVDEEELNAEWATAREALRRILQRMPAEDSMIIRLHYEEGMSVAEIARTLAIPQKPLYRRLERLLEHLREQLEAEGISRERVSDFLDGAAT
jgi:RNA polymerase sigma factor for flagellar operon FliA